MSFLFVVSNEKNWQVMRPIQAFHLSVIDMDLNCFTIVNGLALFSSPTTLHTHQLYGLTRSFTKLIKEINYVYHGLKSLHADSHNKWTM